MLAGQDRTAPKVAMTEVWSNGEIVIKSGKSKGKRYKTAPAAVSAITNATRAYPTTKQYSNSLRLMTSLQIYINSTVSSVLLIR